MKNRLLTFLTTVMLASALHAQVFDPEALAEEKPAGATVRKVFPIFGPEALAEAKSMGASASSASQAFQVDENGIPVLDADGKPLTQPNSVTSLTDSLRMYQDITGIQGVEQLAAPSQVARTGSARVTIDQSFRFNCRLTRPGKTFSASALAFQLVNCEMAGGSVSEVQLVNLLVCDAATRAGTCGQPSDFDKPVQLTNGQYLTFADLSIGLGCNSVSECQVSVKGTYTAGGNDASLRAGAQDAGSTSNFVADLRKVVTEGNYAGEMREVGRPLADCARANRDRPDGSVLGCDGETIVKIKSPSNSCDNVRQCLKEAVSVQSFERTCERSFPLTERQTKLSYTKTLTCEIEEFADSKVPSTNSCGADIAPKPTAGYSFVGRTPASCSLAEESCVSATHTEYWVDTSAFDTLSVSGNPAPVGGACDVRPDSPTSYTSCSSWFGRTAATASCTGLFVDESTGSPSGEASISISTSEPAAAFV